MGHEEGCISLGYQEGQNRERTCSTLRACFYRTKLSMVDPCWTCTCSRSSAHGNHASASSAWRCRNNHESEGREATSQLVGSRTDVGISHPRHPRRESWPCYTSSECKSSKSHHARSRAEALHALAATRKGALPSGNVPRLFSESCLTFHLL